MNESLHEIMRRGIEAQGKFDPDAIASAAPDAIPGDEEAWRMETGNLPELEPDEPVEHNMREMTESLPLDDVPATTRRPDPGWSPP